MANRIRYKQFDQLSFADSLVFSSLPRHPFWSNIESMIDFSFADRLCSVLYTGRGQYPFAPSLKLKVHLIQTYYDLSDRLTEEKIIGDLFIKRFLQLPVDFFGFDHSTIGLDRGRMGTAMFQACHFHILAQMLFLGLWGDKNEQWVIDSFPCHVLRSTPGSYRLLQQAMLRILNHLKRYFPDAFASAESALELDSLMKRFSRDTEKRERLLAFSRLTAQAHGLLEWFESDQTNRLICSDEKKAKARGRLYEMRDVLHQVLKDYTRETQTNEPNSDPPNPPEDRSAGREPTASPPEKDPTPPEAASVLAEEETCLPDRSASSPEPEPIRYEKIPQKERPADRIVSAAHPDVRVGMKTASFKILGFKNQVLTTKGGVVLHSKVIPAAEHDREAMVGMLKDLCAEFRKLPHRILGDTAYGHGKQRALLEAMGIETAAPVPVTPNPKGLLDHSRFIYLKDKDVFICPQGKETVRKTTHNRDSQGIQYYFNKKDCQSCPLQEACTKSKQGRSIFLSDYHNLYEKAKAFNESSEGEEASRNRYVVERKNQELKNNCGLGSPNVARQSTLGMKSSMAAMVVNLKLVLRKLVAPKPGFLRRA